MSPTPWPELGLADKVRLLKLGFTHPLPEDLLADFLAPLEKVLVVEELEPYLEEGLKAVAQARGLSRDHPGQRPGPLFPPLRIPPGPGAGGHRPVFRGGL